MSDKRLAIPILILGAILLAFQLTFKPRIDADNVRRLKDHFNRRGSFVGQYAPDFSAELLDGSTFRLSDVLGTNVVVINFFTTWCGPCRSEMDELTYFVESTREMPVVFLAIDVGEAPEDVAAFVDELELSFRVAVDQEKVIAGKYGLRAFPTTVVISPDGRIVSYETGAIANTDVSLMPLVKAFTRTLEHANTTFDLDDYRKNAPDRLVPEEPDEEDDEAEAEDDSEPVPPTEEEGAPE